MGVDSGRGEPRKKDVALAIIVDRIAQGRNATLQDIADALGVSKQRARQLVDQLVKSGQVERTPGAVRALRVPNVAASRAVLEDVLSRHGWIVAGPFTNVQLPLFPPFEHLPDVD